MINYRGLNIPHVSMGRVTSDNLFDPNEQVIFDFYEANKNRYTRVVDIGANIGVHSILMARAGWQVRAYEPDPVHFAALRRNVDSHGVSDRVDLCIAAVSVHDGAAVFVRVLDNTTGSHLEGEKRSYGPVERTIVRTVDFRILYAWADFVKIDCEGHEAALVESVDWSEGADAMLEVGSPESADRIFQHVDDAPMWAQKIGWKLVTRLEDVPKHHSEGSLFIGTTNPFPEVAR